MKVKGYTLIEILVALTIIGILFGAGYVGYRDFSRRQSLAGTVKIIQGDLRKIQQNALSGIKPAGCASPNNLTGYYLTIVPSDNKYNVKAGCSNGSSIQVGEEIYLPENISITPPSPNPILFKVLGLGTNIPTDTTTIVLTQDLTGNTATITIGSGGDIK
jgi:prepilin-type N-terminal cleavage/methylation domain-containing protein